MIKIGYFGDDHYISKWYACATAGWFRKYWLISVASRKWSVTISSNSPSPFLYHSVSDFNYSSDLP